MFRADKCVKAIEQRIAILRYQFAALDEQLDRCVATEEG